MYHSFFLPLTETRVATLDEMHYLCSLSLHGSTCLAQLASLPGLLFHPNKTGCWLLGAGSPVTIAPFTRHHTRAP